MTFPDRNCSICSTWLKPFLLPFQALRWLIHQIFGELFWRPPRWAAFIGRGACAAGRHPLLTLVGVVVLAALVGGWFWWQAQPKPTVVTLNVTNPTLTDLVEEKPMINPLIIAFSAPVATLESADKEVASENIVVSPPLKGKWKWEGDSTLTLRPDTDWAVGAEYTVTFSPKMFRPEARFDSYKTKFQTAVFAMSVLDARFAQSPTDPKDKKVVALVRFTHPVDAADFEKRISLVMEGQEKGVLGLGEKKTAFQVSFDKKKLTAFIHSTTLPIPEKPQTMRVMIDKGARAASGGNTTSEALTAMAGIPGIDSLQITDLRPIVVTNEKFQSEQVLTLQLSMLAQERQAKDAIKVWLLPKQPPEGYLQRARSNVDPNSDKLYQWSGYDVSFIDQVILKSGEALKLEALPSENDVADTFSYRYQAPPWRFLYVQVPKGLTAFGGYRLGKDRAVVFQVPAYPAVAKIMSEGSLLSLSGERKLSVMARDVPAIRYTIGRVLPQQLQFLVGKGLSYGNFSKPEFYSGISESDIVERFEKAIELPAAEPGKPQYRALDLSEYLNAGGKMKRGVFLLRVQAYDPRTKQNLGIPDHRLVMVSDLGLIDKRTVAGGHDIFVQSIYRGGPVGGATIEVIGRNGLPVTQVQADANGHATLPNLNDFKNERAPVFLLVSKDSDSSFLPLNYANRFLNYSRFDVGGAVNATDAKQLSAYLFSDRGIYRPGEEIRVGMIARSTNWAQSVAGIPLELEVIDARGLTVRRDKITLPESGFGELRHPTLDTAPAGTYTINLSLVKKGNINTLIGSTTVRVQDFEPDRLKMSARFNQGPTEGWVTPEDLAVQVSLLNLFATPAEDRRVRGFMSLTPGVLKFARYKDYLFNDPFDDPKHPKEPVSEELSETKTDAQGQATLKLDLQRFARATYRAQVVVQGYEADGGRGVSAETAILVSGLDYLVGYKPDGKLEFVRRDSARAVDLLAIGRDGKQRAVEGLKLQHIERRFVSVLTRQLDGTYRYQSKEKEVLLDETPLTIAAAGQPLKLATETPGAFSYVVRDAEGLEYARIAYSVAGEANLTRSLDKNAELKLTLSKGDFAPGEDIEVQIEAPYVGHGLITVERDKVYTHRWFSTKTTSTVQKIALPKDVDGNAYLTVTFVRDPGSDEIYMSPLSFGVAPFSVSRERYRLKLDVAAPDKIKSGDTATFKVKSDKPSKVAVFAVDEGILQVARYKMADPLGYFFQKRALEVSTSQLLDLILPEFSRVMAASAPGGDAEGALGRFLNPFKRKRDPAVAYWSGIVDVGADGKTLSWKVPESFNGSLRVMAVAVTPQSVGVYEGHTTVRGDFVLSPTAPLSVTPGDEFDVPVGVSNNLEGSGKDAKVKVTLDGGEYFETVGEKTIEVPIVENREGVVHFRARAKPLLGSGTLSLTAGIGDKKSKLTTAVSVRPATPYRQEFQAGVVASGKEVELPMARRLFAEHRKLDVGVSASPMVMANGLAAYLDNYSYTCTEQIVSQAIPALVLSHRPEFGEIKSKRGATLSGLMTMLRARQNAEGAYGLWAGNAIVSEPASVWAQQFLVEAKDRGETVPADMLQRGNEWLQNFAMSEGDTLFDDRSRALAVYVLTRQGMQT
ncbi:MAG: alpha-2-macroglobulin, partial [Burkholderiales bacterium]|nr:alpha-2-macroglobulin [Burkholderiales bacterium]